ncbi:MAG: YifB family Mg chelatase-like AAA ATPase [Oscillospiraceae bacterium]
MFLKINSLGLMGLNAFCVDVEIDAVRGTPGFDIVGLADVAVKESRERVRSAVKNSGVSFPLSRVMVNLAPADTKKSGSVHDLAIYMAVLCVAGAVTEDLSYCAFVGELSLGGGVRSVNGVLPMAIQAKKSGIKKLFVPKDNAFEASVADGLEIYGVDNVTEIIEHFRSDKKIPRTPVYSPEENSFFGTLDYSEVKGQQNAKRAAEIAAAGGHNMLLIGTPGSGKSMIAKRLPTILPPMSFEESLETTQIYSVAGQINPQRPLVTERPFRSPHHTISMAGLSGGGAVPRPGEISLSHNGVLFLDELPEFSRTTLEVLRQPLEDGTVTISRAAATVSYPCSFMLVAAMNPCPCGFSGHPSKKCTCSPKQTASYLSKISGPLLDRIDLHVEVSPVEYSSLQSDKPEETSAEIRARVLKAREIQNRRFEGTDIRNNAGITAGHLQEFCPLSDGANAALKAAFEKMGLSARAYERIVKVARTIADLSGSKIIEREHIAQAIQYRSLDRKYWNR